ncbi:hypothetical protein [Sinorhizobium medicae]|uniref:hypothetical protein n=1 Tax=Sinorhizobium medicae TaxID=110321 RepID=UPI003C757E68
MSRKISAVCTVPENLGDYSPIERQAWGQRVFRFYDPDEHAIEVGEPQDLGGLHGS